MFFFSFISICFGIILNVCQCNETHYFFYSYTGNDGKIIVNSNDTQLNPVDVPQWTTQAYYNASQNLTGWDLLELWSNPLNDDMTQAYHAGYIEGYITRQQIWNFYWNNIESMTHPNSSQINSSIVLSDYFKINNKYVDEMVEQNQNDPFWYQVGLIYQQMYGMLDGYNNATNDQNISDQILPLHHLLYAIFIEDIEDILMSNITNSNNHTGHNETKSKHTKLPDLKTGQHCSALIKIVPGNSDVFIGHDTWSRYSQMNRILKRYKLPFRMSKNSSELIPGMSTTFSSYPAMFASVDDFYVINSGLVTLETTNDVYNRSLYKYVHPKWEVLEEVRNVVANRLATNGSTWKEYFERNNSGTYNNQWMIVDLNNFKPGFDPQEGFLTVIEQAPGYFEGGDQTPHILQHGYWASYNIPFYKNMSKVTGNLAAGLNNSWFSYTECPRAKMFKRDQMKVNDLDSMIWMMRYNYYETDPYSVCNNCTPKSNACNAIASRCDLNPEDGKYGNTDLGPALFGSIDTKVVSFSLFSKGEFLAIGGPTTSGVPPFSWSTTKVKSHLDDRHMGQPDKWDFQPIITTWILPYSTKPQNNSVVPTTTTQASPSPTHKKKNSSALTQPLSIMAYLSIVLFLALKV